MVERLLFLLITLASVAYFAATTLRRLAAMRTAEADLSTDRPLHRLARTFAEVALQARVIRDRPVAGILHALVMWGFFAFAWVSAEHVYLGLVGLEHAEASTSWYATFAAVWAVAATAGILGLAIRRFILRPHALGAISPSSGVVALLIVVLMATYLAGWTWLEIGSNAWRVNWWLHSLSLLGMFWIIPTSKHLHLVLGPAAVFFRGATISATRPLRDEDDDDFGMLFFADLSRKDILDVNSCVECGRCTDVCPANRSGGDLSPKSVILQMQHGLLAGGNLAEKHVAGTSKEVADGQAWVAEADLYECFTCGACEEACPVGIEHVGKKIIDLRRGLVSEGRTHSDKLSGMFNTMERAPHNAWGIGHDVRRKLIEADELPIYDGSQDWLLWMGCGASYDPHGQATVRAMKRIFEASDVSWGVLRRESCCGETARRAGNEYLYMELSAKVIEALAGSGAKSVVTCDPHCCRMLDVDYRQSEEFRELAVRVVHHTELIAELTPKLNLKPQVEALTYHDPCYLARGRDVTRQPRETLVQLGAELTEMAEHGRKTSCCGAGGAQLFLADDTAGEDSARVNQLRFTQAQATGAATVAVACPYCAIMLDDAAGGALRIADVAELTAERLA